MFWEKVKEWVNYNRFTVIAVLAAIAVWFGAIGCDPVVDNPVQPGQLVNATELQLEFEQWQSNVNIVNKKFELAGQAIEKQKEKMAALEKVILDLAAGAIPFNAASLVQILITGGFLGFAVDNIRKRGLIAGLKRNG